MKIKNIQKFKTICLKLSQPSKYCKYLYCSIIGTNINIKYINDINKNMFIQFRFSFSFSHTNDNLIQNIY